MKIKLEEAVELLQNEIVWCLDHPDPLLTFDQRMGFMRGLRQAQYLLKAAEQSHVAQANKAGICPLCEKERRAKEGTSARKRRVDDMQQYLCARCGHPRSEHPCRGCVAFAEAPK